MCCPALGAGNRLAYRAVPLKHGPEEVIVFSTSVADRVMFGVFGAETLFAVQDWPVAECADTFAWVAATLAACSVELPYFGLAKDFVFLHRKFRSANFEPEPQISMKFRRAARARKFRNKFRDILAWANTPYVPERSNRVWRGIARLRQQ